MPSLDEITPPPDGQIIITHIGVVICTMETLMRATDDMVSVANLRVALARRNKPVE